MLRSSHGDGMVRVEWLELSMSTEHKKQNRELTEDEINSVSGGLLGEICLIVGACSLAIAAIGVADAKGVFDPVKLPF
jgi:hypothetical protein